MARLPLQTNARAGTIALVNGYRQSVGLELGRLNRSRPLKGILLPDVYIDRITEGTEGFTKRENQRTVAVALRIVWGKTYSGDAVDQRDRFVDGFYDYVSSDTGDDAFGGNATVDWRSVTDDPQFTPEWDTGTVDTYFMTEITLEGFAAT